jgi:hypothetical protein
MNAIREYVDVQQGNIVQFQLPDDFKATRVEVIVLPFEQQKQAVQNKRRNRILALKGSIVGSAADSLEKHTKEIREEW